MSAVGGRLEVVSGGANRRDLPKPPNYGPIGGFFSFPMSPVGHFSEVVRRLTISVHGAKAEVSIVIHPKLR